MIEPCKLTYRRTWRFGSSEGYSIALSQADWITEICGQHPDMFIEGAEVENTDYTAFVDSTITLTLRRIP